MSAIHLICNCGSSCCLSRSISAWGWIFSSNLSLSPCSMNSSVTNLAARFCTCHCFVDAAKSDDVINIAISMYRCESSSQLYSLDSIRRKNLFLNLRKINIKLIFVALMKKTYQDNTIKLISLKKFLNIWINAFEKRLYWKLIRNVWNVINFR